jgi:hypothetical protein
LASVAHLPHDDKCEHTGYPAELAFAEDLQVGDFDGDGAKDIVAYGYPNSTPKLWMFRSTASSQLVTTAMTSTTPSGRLHVDHVAGRARDALLDVYVDSTTTDIFHYATDSQGVSAKIKIATFPVGSAYTTLYGFAIGDFNGDALTDVVEIGDRHYKSGPTPLELTCDRSGAWQMAELMLPEDTRILRAIDFDSDTKNELVARVGTDVVVFALH